MPKFTKLKKAIFANPETCNFGEQGMFFNYESEGYDDVVTDRLVTTEKEAKQWLFENYHGEFEVKILR